MRTREFLVLGDDDREFIDRAAAGLGRETARAFAYLALRERADSTPTEPATRMTIRVGTGLGRKVVTEALGDLEERGLVATGHVRTGEQGRPPKTWHATDASDDALDRVYATHADRLLGRARAVAESWIGDPVGADDPVTVADSESATGDADALTVGLNWPPNALHAPVFAASRAAAYDRRGLDVGFEHHHGSDAALASVAAGDADVGVVGAATLLRARDRRETTAVPLAILLQRSPTALYATGASFDGRFASVEQLRGRTLGVPVGSETDVLVRLYLSQADVLADVEVVDTGGEERDALLDGRADAVTGSVADPDRLRSEGFEVSAVRLAERFPAYGPALVAPPAALRERADALARFLAAAAEGWGVATARPDDAVAATREVAGAVDDHDRRAFEGLVADPSNAVRDRGWGWQRVEEWRRLATALDQADLLDGAVRA